jgi:hypothetical protein
VITHCLPVPLIRFLGREQEIIPIRNPLSSLHPVTLTGPGGSIKIRWALQIADGMRETCEDGVRLIELVPLHDPGLVPQHVVPWHAAYVQLPMWVLQPIRNIPYTSCLPAPIYPAIYPGKASFNLKHDS